MIIKKHKHKNLELKEIPKKEDEFPYMMAPKV